MVTGAVIDLTALEASLRAVGERIAATPLEEALHTIVGATRTLVQATGAGVMFVDDDSLLRAVAATDEPGHQLESWQEKTGEGPCVDALVFDRIVPCADLAHDPRWPQVAPAAAENGIHAVLGVPIHTANVTVGSLNVYRDAPHDWDDSEIHALGSYALLVERLLISALEAEQLTQLTEQLQHALDHRVTIERAVGMIMGREGIDAVMAFDRLRRIARGSGRKAADVAGEILGQF